MLCGHERFLDCALLQYNGDVEGLFENDVFDDADDAAIAAPAIDNTPFSSTFPLFSTSTKRTKEVAAADDVIGAAATLSNVKEEEKVEENDECENSANGDGKEELLLIWTLSSS